MKTDDNVVSDWKSLDSIEKILDAIRHHEIDIREYLADTVASLCSVDKETMLGDCDKVYVAQARWLFWYAYRYMSGDTFEKIAKVTSNHNNGIRNYTANAVGSAYNKMSVMINNEPMWQKRWSIVKRIIKLREDPDEKKADNTIVINIPRELKEQIKIEIKEK